MVQCAHYYSWMNVLHEQCERLTHRGMCTGCRPLYSSDWSDTDTSDEDGDCW